VSGPRQLFGGADTSPRVRGSFLPGGYAYAKAWRVGAPPPPLVLTDGQLATMFAWSRERVRETFPSARVAHPRYLYEWQTVRVQASPALLEESRARILALRTKGKQWLSGYDALAAEWHPTKNGLVFPLDVSFGSSRPAWWSCLKGPDHQWRAKPGNRTRLGNRCPFCRGKNVSVTNSLATLAPDVAREWHPTANGRLTANAVTPGSARKVYWKCHVDGHVWRATVSNRVGHESGCPLCAIERRGERAPVAARSLAVCAPAAAAEWHPTRNGTLTPLDVTRFSSRVVWWRCERDESHEWRANVATRGRAHAPPTGCPHCPRPRPPTPLKLLADLRPDLAREWDRARNGELTPKDVVVGSGKRVWWRCARDPSHRWQRTIRNRSQMAGPSCPMCKAAR
jgi:hypothetical protein